MAIQLGSMLLLSLKVLMGLRELASRIWMIGDSFGTAMRSFEEVEIEKFMDSMVWGLV